MHVTLVQYDVAWQDPSTNYGRVSELLAGVTATDLIVLPEMWSTGFSMDVEALAETEAGSTVRQMIAWADEYHCQVTGTVIIKEGDKYYNRFLLVTSDGIVGRYDKRHLFSLAGEEEHFTAGTQKVIWEISEWRVCPMVCYDLRFPVWSRNYEDYDLLLYAASWPRMRHHAWQTLLQARAIENQCYVIGCNRTGKDGNGFPHKGGSAIVGPTGKAIRLDDEEGLLMDDLSRPSMLSFRKNYPFLGDMKS